MLDDDRLPGEPTNKGWNRASIIFWSRKPYRPRIRKEDLVLPKHLAGLRLVGTCLVTAACVTAIAVWTPLFFLNVFVGLSGIATAVVLVAAVVVLTLVLYFWVARETRRDRELASRM
jgi:peptidoglycan biosynthesis protein MviN/MurJ (putative lipid II flippase)